MENEGFQVRMLGEFSISYKGKEVILGKRSTLKYMQLLQFIWYYGNRSGVKKESLIRALYGGEGVADSNNSLNNLIYQLRRQMVKTGLPNGEYIIRSDGFYMTDPRFPVKLDVQEFEDLLSCESGSKEKISRYQAAFELYRGELLPSISTEMWVISENSRLKSMYGECVNCLADYYEKQLDYQMLEQIYERASKIYPYDNWQLKQIETLLKRKNYKKAYVVYNDMVHQYSEEMGLPPSPEMLNCYETLSQMSEHVPGDLENIKRDMREYINIMPEEAGAYYCSYRSFVDICHVTSRRMERHGRSVFLMLCTLVDYERKMIMNEEKLRKRSQLIKEVISSCLRKGDVFTKYNSAQYLILLEGAKQEDCEVIYRRIRKKFKERSGYRSEVEYLITSMADLVDHKKTL
ncbi:BTAD domain-containing putative transcriptional regulator [Lacrimispora sp. JR3]|uniref:BTAD domain-containing putative transcriptional regulator n=1 Tax=Lacrimispora sinapis TaxID=3111456 RepID=UPI003749007F